MKTLFLVGLVASTAFAQAPDSISGMIYWETTHGSTSEFKYVTLVSLRTDGTYTTILREHFFWLSAFWEPVFRTVDNTDSGTFLYGKTGTHTATLVLTSSDGNSVTTRNLEFDSGSSGYFWFEPSSGGTFYISSIAAAPIVNSSARGTASASKAVILGFCVPEPYPRYVLVRAVGPGLTQFDVPDAAEDTTLEVFGSGYLPPGTFVAKFGNDDWEMDSVHIIAEGAPPPATSVGAFMGAFPLSENSKDAAIVMPFPPGAYTVVIRTKSETPAEVLGEVYIVP